MIIKIKPSRRFETTAKYLREISKYRHAIIFTKTQVRRVLNLLKTKKEVKTTAKCGEVDCIFSHYYDVEKTDNGNLQIGCSVMAKKDVQRLRKWANRK